MEQKNFVKNISGTACVLGLALSTMSVNNTMLVNINDNYKIQKVNLGYYDESLASSVSATFDVSNSNIFEINSSTRLLEEANELFGEMRDATPEEQLGINRYIKSISRDTGVNFFDIC